MALAVAVAAALSIISPAAALSVLAPRRLQLGSVNNAAPCGRFDFDGSSIIGVADLLLTLGAFGQSVANPAAARFDLNDSGSVDVGDLLLRE